MCKKSYFKISIDLDIYEERYNYSNIPITPQS